MYWKVGLEVEDSRAWHSLSASAHFTSSYNADNTTVRIPANHQIRQLAVDRERGTERGGPRRHLQKL